MGFPLANLVIAPKSMSRRKNWRRQKFGDPSFPHFCGICGVEGHHRTQCELGSKTLRAKLQYLKQKKIKAARQRLYSGIRLVRATQRSRAIGVGTLPVSFDELGQFSEQEMLDHLVQLGGFSGIDEVKAHPFFVRCFAGHRAIPLRKCVTQARLRGGHGHLCLCICPYECPCGCPYVSYSYVVAA